MFTGDCVLGCGSTVFTDLAVYMKSLESLLACTWAAARYVCVLTLVWHWVSRSLVVLPLPVSPKTVYPGHGPVVRDGVSKISEYIDHRNAREKQVVSALEGKPAGASPMQLVATIYAKVRGTDIHPLLPSSPLTTHTLMLVRLHIRTTCLQHYRLLLRAQWLCIVARYTPVCCRVAQQLPYALTLARSPRVTSCFQKAASRLVAARPRLV